MADAGLGGTGQQICRSRGWATFAAGPCCCILGTRLLSERGLPWWTAPLASPFRTDRSRSVGQSRVRVSVTPATHTIKSFQVSPTVTNYVTFSEAIKLAETTNPHTTRRARGCSSLRSRSNTHVLLHCTPHARSRPLHMPLWRRSQTRGAGVLSIRPPPSYTVISSPSLHSGQRRHARTPPLVGRKDAPARPQASSSSSSK